MFEEILAALTARGIRFVIVGGVAATVQGSARFTNDLDLCYDTAPGIVARLVAFRSLTLEALIASKRAARRRKDLEHLVEPEAIQAMRARKAKG